MYKMYREISSIQTATLAFAAKTKTDRMHRSKCRLQSSVACGTYSGGRK